MIVFDNVLTPLILKKIVNPRLSEQNSTSLSVEAPRVRTRHILSRNHTSAVYSKVLLTQTLYEIIQQRDVDICRTVGEQNVVGVTKMLDERTHCRTCSVELRQQVIVLWKKHEFLIYTDVSDRIVRTLMLLVLAHRTVSVEAYIRETMLDDIVSPSVLHGAPETRLQLAAHH